MHCAVVVPGAEHLLLSVISGPPAIKIALCSHLSSGSHCFSWCAATLGALLDAAPFKELRHGEILRRERD